jgi:predicted nucleic acid-binding protein
MRFWDSSAIVPLLVDEPTSGAAETLLAEDREMVVCWSTEVECASALARLEREKKLSSEGFVAAGALLDALAGRWQEVAPTRELRGAARRLLRLHPLTASDALQLAAAMAIAENEPSSLGFVTLDVRLREAALRQGFTRIFPTSLA